MHSDTCAQVRGSQVTHDLYMSVPKLIISSNSIRLLNVVGQGIFNYNYRYFFPDSITLPVIDMNYYNRFLDQMYEHANLACLCEEYEYALWIYVGSFILTYFR